MISASSVGKQYRNGRWGLREVSFSVQKGEFVVLTGPSGSGKTTLMKLLSFEEKPTEGELILEGKINGKVKKRQLPFIRRRIGLVFQDFRLLPDRSAHENVAFVLKATGTGTNGLHRRVLRALAAVGLSGRGDSMPDELSGGEQQRVGIARAIVNDPLVVLADEPTGNLDDATKREISRVPQESVRQGNGGARGHARRVGRTRVPRPDAHARGRPARGRRAAGRRPSSGRAASRRASAPDAHGDRDVSTLLFTLKEGVLNLRRAPLLSLTSVAVMGLSLFVLGIFLLITVNLRAAIAAVQKQVEVVVFVKEDIRDEELKSLDAFLREHPGVADVRFLTRDDALAKFRGELKEREYLLEALETNPLPDTFEVALFDDWKSTERIAQISDQIQGMAGVDEVKYGKEWVGRLNRMILVLVLIDMFLGAVVALSSLVVVANTVKLTLIARREMIELMKMVGATVGVIRRPFVIEGVLKGGLAAAFASMLLAMLTSFLETRVPEVVALSVPAFPLPGVRGVPRRSRQRRLLQGFLKKW
jgi:cell division transport system ATP-binding protein